MAAQAAAVQSGPAVVREVKLEDTADILKKLTEATADTGEAALNARFETLEKQLKATEKIADKQQRDIAIEIIKADMASLIATSEKEVADLAVAVNDLDTLAEQLGGDFEKLQQLDETEKKLITDAEAALETAKGAWFNKEEKVKTAEKLLAEAKIEAAKSMRKRLLSSTFEQSTTIFKRRAYEAIKILGVRRDRVEAQLKNVVARKGAAFEILSEAAKAKTDLEGKLLAAEQELQLAESELAGLTNGTPEYTAQDTKVSGLKAKVVDLTGQVNVTLTIYQSKELFTKQLGVHETTQTKLKNNITMWISGLKSDMDERIVTIESRLEAAKAMSDQEFASKLDKLGAKLDQESTEFMAKAGVVSDKLMLERLESQPERMRKLDEVAVGQARHHIEVTQHLGKLREEYSKRYGIDLFAGSFLEHSNPNAGAHVPA